MKTTIKLLALLILVTVSSCNNSKKIEFKYTESIKLLTCDLPNVDLLKEAIYAFENDIINTYDAQNRNIVKSYTSYINLKSRNKADVKEIASAHSLAIAKALKEDTNLWTVSNGVTTLNTSHSLIIDCIANNIKNKDIKTSYKALLSTNSFKSNLILPLFIGNTGVIQTDGSLKSFVALEYFYSQLLDVRLEELKNPNPQLQPEPIKPAVNKVDFNKTPKVN
ncbi:hypothetical protein [Lacinutrix sp.]|uniref:hypothetical protein n=1 Tax=Lacinutrix sp. TaxID=1937692 RepID=UPI0025B8324F|nr:hypothetical protein [Lacinutrix sp.]